MLRNARTAGIRLFQQRSTPLSRAEWNELFAAHLELMKTRLPLMDLPALDTLPAFADYHSQSHRITRGTPSLTDAVGQGYKTKAIFPNFNSGNPFHCTFLYGDGNGKPATGSILKTWGLTSAGVWISVEAHTKITRPPNTGTQGIQNAVAIVIDSHTDPIALFEWCACDPRDVLKRLGTAYRDWIQKLGELHQEAVREGYIFNVNEELVAGSPLPAA